MSDTQQYHGAYYLMGLLLNVTSVEGQLLAAVPGVPEGYEVVLEPVGEDRFITHGGPLDGATIGFARDEGGTVTTMKVGSYDLVRIDPDDVEGLPVVERLLAPECDLTPAKSSAFDGLLQTCLNESEGEWIDYDLPYPKHEFVQFVTDRGLVIFHGSNNTEIESFSPVRKSVELRDDTGRGNVQGVYGTHDGLWAMFFAVVDRGNLEGSVRNGVMYFENRSGERIAAYNFSVNQEQLADAPYVEGALYLLPREPFTRLMLTEEVYANEWVCEGSVDPLAKLRLRPADFPFLERIGGHDDGAVMRLGAIAKSIRTSATAATLQDDRFEVAIPAGVPAAAQLEEYVELQRIYMPAARFEVREIDGGALLVATGLPPAVQHALSESYAGLLRE